MFINWSTDQTFGETYSECIRPEQFEVKGWRVCQNACLTAMAGAIVGAIGILLMMGESCGSTMFWVGTGEGLFGITVIILAKTIHGLDQKKHQCRFLHRAQSHEEYKTLLQSDRGVQYQFYDKGYLQKRKSTDRANLTSDTAVDLPRSLWMVNGESVHYTEIGGKQWDGANDSYNPIHYTNQSIFAPLRFILCSRYQSKNKAGRALDANDIVIKNIKRHGADGYSTRFNLITDPFKDNQVNFLEGEAHFRLCPTDDDPILLKYIVGKIRVDFATGDAVCTWSSPQDEYPTFH